VAPHDGEFKVNSFSYGATNTASVTTGTTGLSAGKISFGPLKISMFFTPAANFPFHRAAALATPLSSVEIRQFNSTRLYYKTVFENALITSITTEGSDGTSQNIEFTYGRVRWFTADATGNATPAGCFDIALNKTC
jgi:type VI protein secretion system component Hcp